jgi:membrane dipeptidase
MDKESKPLGLKNTLFLVGGAIGTLVLMVVIIVIFIVTTKPDTTSTKTPEELVDDALSAMPIIHGRNLFASNIRELAFNDLSTFDFSGNLSAVPPWSESDRTQTDLPRLKDGRTGAVFWSAFADCNSQHKDAVSQTMEQIDVIKRLVDMYSNDLRLVSTANGLEAAIEAGVIGSVISVGAGHSIQSSLGVLRQYQELGVRCIALTHECNTPWADSGFDQGNFSSSGISAFGESIIEEMNRLGLVIDLSYASKDAALSALKHSVAPVLFSSSGAHSVCPDPRNLDDEVLKLVAEKKGLVMVGADAHNSQCSGRLATIQDIAEHIEHIRNVTSIDNVGIGGNFDGTDKPALDLEDPSKYPDLFLELAITKRWSQEDLEKLSGRNLLRVLRSVEKTQDEQNNKQPIQRTITKHDLDKNGFNQSCMAAKYKEL